MENLDNISNSELKKLIQLYNQIFSIFKRFFFNKLKKEYGVDENDKIVDIRRGLMDGRGKVFRNYLGATHYTCGNLSDASGGIDPYNAYHCIELTLLSGKKIVIAKSSQGYLDHQELPEGMLSLDSYYLLLNDYTRNEFDKIFLTINQVESNYFHSNKYVGYINQIKTLSKEGIIEALNIKPE